MENENPEVGEITINQPEQESETNKTPEQNQSQEKEHPIKEEGPKKKSSTTRTVCIVLAIVFGVIALMIVVMSILLYISLSRARKNARDSQRIGIANSIANAEELYFEQYGSYGDYSALKSKNLLSADPSVDTFEQKDWKEICCNVSKDGKKWSITVKLENKDKDFYCSQDGCKNK